MTAPGDNTIPFSTLSLVRIVALVATFAVVREGSSETTIEDAERTATAEGHYQVGVEAYQQHRFLDAIAAWERADAMISSPAITMNIARALTVIGRRAEACERFQRAIDAIGGEGGNGGLRDSERWEHIKQEAVRELESQRCWYLSRLRLRVSSGLDSANTRVWIDAREVAVELLKAFDGIAVDSGRRHVVIRRPGSCVIVREIDVMDGELITIAVESGGGERQAHIGDSATVEARESICTDKKLSDSWFYLQLEPAESSDDHCGDPNRVRLWTDAGHGSSVEAEWLRSSGGSDGKSSRSCIAVRVPENFRPPALDVEVTHCESQIRRYPNWITCSNARTPCVYPTYSAPLTSTSCQASVRRGEWSTRAKPADHPAVSSLPPFVGPPALRPPPGCSCGIQGRSDRVPAQNIVPAALVALWWRRNPRRMRSPRRAVVAYPGVLGEQRWRDWLVWCGIATFVSGSILAWWRNALTPGLQDLLAMAVAVVSSIAWPWTIWLARRGVGTSFTKFTTTHSAMLRWVLGLVGLAAGLHFWSNALRAVHVYFDCGVPLPSGFSLRAGERELTGYCNLRSVWVHPTARVEAFAPGYERFSAKALTDLRPARDGTLKVALVPRNPWSCRIEAKGKASPLRCNGQGRDSWKFAEAYSLTLVGEPATNNLPARFMVHSLKPESVGVGFAGIGGCLVLAPSDPTRPAAEIRTTPDCVQYTADRHRTIRLLAFVCGNAGEGLDQVFELRAYEGQEQGSIKVGCNK